jgi:hypothetical protein
MRTIDKSFKLVHFVQKCCRCFFFLFRKDFFKKGPGPELELDPDPDLELHQKPDQEQIHDPHH